MKRICWIFSVCLLMVLFQMWVSAEEAPIQVVDMPVEADQVTIQLSGGRELTCTRDGAYWNIMEVTVSPEEIAGVSVQWGEGYRTELPRSVLVFSAEQDAPVKIFVPKTVSLTTYTVVHQYYAALPGEAESEGMLEGTQTEEFGTYTGATLDGEVLGRLPQYEGVSYQFVEVIPEIEEVRDTGDSYGFTLYYVRENDGALESGAQEPTNETPGSSVPVQQEAPGGATELPLSNESILSDHNASTPPVWSDASSPVSSRRPASVAASEAFSEPGTGDAGTLSAYLLLAAVAITAFAALLFFRNRKGS